MRTALVGLLGVIIGAFLTLMKDFWFEYRTRRKNLEFLSIQVVCMLDRYIVQCVDVAQDDGLCQGEYGNDGCRHAQAHLPKFEPHLIEVEWKSLPAILMYKVLNFPNEIEEVNRRIESISEFTAFPPDFEEFFEERQYRYAILGLKAASLASELRIVSKISEKEFLDWNPIEILKNIKLGFEKKIAMNAKPVV